MSHHGSSAPGDENAPAELEAELHKRMGKLLGEYPDGKLNPQDEGAIAMAVTSENGVVKLVFPKPVAWIGMTPQQAAQLGQDLLKHAARAGHMPFVITI